MSEGDPQIITVLSTLVAAFAGAWAAFRFQNHQRTREEESRRVAAVNRALYTIYNMWNVLYQYDQECLKPYRGEPDAWLNVAATFPSSYGLTRFDAEGLVFMLQSGHPNLFASLMLEEQRFLQALSQIEYRSKLVDSEVSPRFAAANVPVGTALDEKDVERILGIDVVHKLKVLTGGMMANVSDSLGSLREAHDALHEAMKKYFRKHKLIKIGFEEPFTGRDQDAT